MTESQPVSDRGEGLRRLEDRLLEVQRVVARNQSAEADKTRAAIAIGMQLAALAHSSPVLDEAWAAAVAALPEGWWVSAVERHFAPDEWEAFALGSAGGDVPMGVSFVVPGESATGPTPAAALTALAAALSDPTEPDRTEEEPR